MIEFYTEGYGLIDEHHISINLNTLYKMIKEFDDKPNQTNQADQLALIKLLVRNLLNKDNQIIDVKLVEIKSYIEKEIAKKLKP
jgi:hypothetical protein